MALTQRFFRLFQADLHGVLDRLEEPDMLLKQALREMEDELENSELIIKRLSRDRDAIARRQQEITESRARADQDLEMCLQSDNEELARTLVKRRLEMEKLSRHLALKLEELETGLHERGTQLSQHRDHYECMRQKAELLEREHTANAAPQDDCTGWLARDFRVRDEEVEIALLKEKQRHAARGREAS